MSELILTRKPGQSLYIYQSSLEDVGSKSIPEIQELYDDLIEITFLGINDTIYNQGVTGRVSPEHVSRLAIRATRNWRILRSELFNQLARNMRIEADYNKEIGEGDAI